MTDVIQRYGSNYTGVTERDIIGAFYSTFSLTHRNSVSLQFKKKNIKNAPNICHLWVTCIICLSSA